MAGQRQSMGRTKSPYSAQNPTNPYASLSVFTETLYLKSPEKATVASRGKA